jgi:hypothetical protein
MRKKALVINCSAPHYNLGAAKLANWLTRQGYEVELCAGDPQMFTFGYDLICLSVIFSWHAPLARDIALRVKGHCDVWCGGPGMRAIENWWKRETGLDCTRGIDSRFDKQCGNYKMVFCSRGCGEGCSFCIVPILEGSTYTLDWNFQPAPILCDNNLAGLPLKFQRFIVNRYRQSSVKLLDANSGFAPRQFTREQYKIWKQIVRTWRFALDEMKEIGDVRRMLAILHKEPASRKRVYVLIGNEPIESCYERAETVINPFGGNKYGGEPFCQPVLPLNFLTDPRDPKTDLHPKYDWTSQKLKDFARYYNRWFWRSMRLWDYKPRRNEAPPFGFMRPVEMAA